MSIILSSPTEIILLIAGLLLFGLIAWREINLAAALILFLAPLYLFKILAWGVPLTVLELLILALVFVWLVKKVKEKNLSLGLDRNILWASGLIIIGSLAATAWSSDLRVSAGIFKSWILEPMAVALIIWDITKTRKQLNNLILSIIASGAAVAIAGLIYWLAGEVTFDGRLRGFYLSPNHLAMYLAPSLLLLVGFYSLTRDDKARAILLPLGLVQAAAFYLTYSYAAWLAVLAALFFLALIWEWGKNKKIWLTAILLVFVVLLITQWPSVKFNNLVNFNHSSWQSRLIVWQSAGQIIKDHWLIGVGPGLFQQYYLAYQKYFPGPYLEWAVPQPHNLWLAWWLQSGLLGLVGFIWLTIIFFKHSYERIRMNLRYSHTIKPSSAQALEGEVLIIILAAVMIYFLAHGLVDTPCWKNDLALIFWSVIVLSDKAGRLFC